MEIVIQLVICSINKISRTECSNSEMAFYFQQAFCKGRNRLALEFFVALIFHVCSNENEKVPRVQKEAKQARVLQN